MDKLAFDEKFYVDLLTKLISETEKLQNNPPDFIPQEKLVAKHVIEVLKPYNDVLKVEEVEYVSGRSNLIITYPGTDKDAVVSFVGMHMDVVCAVPENWEVKPFELTRKDDKLYGRGTTDCLGHVALLTAIMVQLAQNKPKLRRSVVAVCIANEENSSVEGVGVDALEKDGKLAHLKNGPLYWVDCADSKPCIGTGGVQDWTLEAEGKLFHSGIAQKAINAIELVSDALAEIQDRFYKTYPAHAKEKEYNFETPSTMKPTAISCPKGSFNQIKGNAEVRGDIRLTPFYDMKDVRKSIETWVEEINANIESVKSRKRGSVSSYELKDEGKKGKLKLTWNGEPFHGIATDLNSPGYKALLKACKDQIDPKTAPFSLTGSLPLVRELHGM